MLTHWDILDSMLTWIQVKNVVRIARLLPGVDNYWINHRLVVSCLNFSIYPSHQHPNKCKQRYDCHKLKESGTS